ncbi:hypothetical protein [Flavobacterium denitrificans]|uniref:hypothetical protein n=1 Tax=Flavobacterium denitrificans TaxID=281361 RepID=UPI00047B399C|nr:hypothetical protein [Flavobacterium denitrificans]
MRNLLIAIIIILLPLFVKSQNFNYQQYTMRPNPLTGTVDRPKLPELETVKPISLNSIEKLQAKLTREEQKLVKLARKTWDQEEELKKEQEQLKNLENDSQNSNDPEHQKKIKALKKQIANSQYKVDQAKAEVALASKKVEDLEKAIEDYKFTRHD